MKHRGSLDAELVSCTADLKNLFGQAPGLVPCMKVTFVTADQETPEGSQQNED